MKEISHNAKKTSLCMRGEYTPPLEMDKICLTRATNFVEARLFESGKKLEGLTGFHACRFFKRGG